MGTPPDTGVSSPSLTRVGESRHPSASGLADQMDAGMAWRPDDVRDGRKLLDGRSNGVADYDAPDPTLRFLGRPLVLTRRPVRLLRFARLRVARRGCYGQAGSSATACRMPPK